MALRIGINMSMSSTDGVFLIGETTTVESFTTDTRQPLLSFLKCIAMPLSMHSRIERIRCGGHRK
jgi:hypothetical protein